MTTPFTPQPMDIASLKARLFRPTRAIVTAGMPYANGPIHIGHLAGAHVPPDIYARWLRMLIGKENVLFVCGTDDHGSTSELAALKAAVPVEKFIKEIHTGQKRTFERYNISFDIFSGTSQPECFSLQRELSDNFLRKLFKNGLLEKRRSQQWYDPSLKRFLQDRFVYGKCPNPKCENEKAYSDECEACGQTYAPSELQNPRSALSEATPELRDTVPWWLDMWKVAEPLRVWVESKAKKWRSSIHTQVLQTILPSLQFDNTFEETFKSIKATLPKHKSRYAPGKKVVAQFENKSDLEAAQFLFSQHKVPTELLDSWAHRSITRDVSWGIPVPDDLDPELAGKTLYVWPDSLIAPISFTKLALQHSGRDRAQYAEFWKDPGARVYQFLGQDNVYFYALMQGAMWLGSQEDPQRLPLKGEFQLSDIFSCYHLLVNGEKMSKSAGNFITADQLLDEKSYTPDQIRYFLALLSLPEKSSNFDFATLDERNKFLAGPLNAAFEKPISACLSKFDGRVPEG